MVRRTMLCVEKTTLPEAEHEFVDLTNQLWHEILRPEPVMMFLPQPQPRALNCFHRLARPSENGTNYCSATLIIMYSLAVKRLYLTVPIKAMSFGNDLALVCVYGQRKFLFSSDSSVCLRAALVRVVTQTRIIIGCVTFLIQTRPFPRYAGSSNLLDFSCLRMIIPPLSELPWRLKKNNNKNSPPNSSSSLISQAYVHSLFIFNYK